MGRNENGRSLFAAVSGVERAIPLFVRAHAEVPSSFDLDLETQCTRIVSSPEGSPDSVRRSEASHFPTRS